MGPAFQVLVTYPDEDEDGKEPAEAVLRVTDRVLAISRYFRHNGAGHWLTWKHRFFRGPWPLQFLLTPLFSFNGVLFSKGNVQWLRTDTDEPRLRLTSFAPAEFWVD